MYIIKKVLPGVFRFENLIPLSNLIPLNIMNGGLKTMSANLSKLQQICPSFAGIKF